MAEFSIGNKIVKLNANGGGYIVEISTARNCWTYKTFGMTAVDYRKALDCFSGYVREWLSEYEEK